MLLRNTLVVAAILLSPLVQAQDLSLVKQEIRIPRGESRSFEFSTVPQKDHTILLDIVARLDSDTYGGSLYFMKITLNGRVVKAAKTRTAVRLVNKSLVSPVAPNTPYTWSDNIGWRVLYAPDFEGALKQTFYEGNPYQTTLDVTDLTNPMSENRLTIENTCTYKPPAGSKANHDLVIKSMNVIIKPGASPMMVGSEVEQDVINRGTPGAGPAPYQGQLLPGGGFSLTTGGKTYSFGAAFSYPNAGLNLLKAGQPEAKCQPGWKITVTPTKDGGTVLGEGPDYRLQRKVRFTPRKVEIEETLTNLHRDAKLGLLVENSMDLTGANANVRLAGNADPAINAYYSPGNPSVYVNLGAQGLGLICEDDIYRNQATLFMDNEKMTAGLRTDKLCLQPGGTYTLKWSVYPVASNDYYDFINLVRQDWGSNYTVKGAWTFFSPDTIIATPVEEIAKQFNALGIKHACYCGGWVDWPKDKKRIGFGTGVLDDYWASFRDRLRQASDKIHQAVPDCKVYVYYDTQRDTSEGGHDRFKDSWLTDPKGNQLATEWGGVYSLTYSVVATLENSYGQAMLKAVDRYLAEMKIDGLYWDEMEGTGYGAPEVTYNVPDGYSCELDPKTYTITREIGINTIMGEGHRMAVIKRVRELGGDMMGNGPTATKGILALKPQRMIEIQHNEYWNYEGNLQSPLGYAGSRMDFGNWVRALKLGTLLVGTRYNYTHDISAYCFPFTPIELHAGYLLGQERLITLHDGNYGWPGQRCLVQARYFDKDGKLTDKSFKTAVDKEARTAVQVTPDEALVLVKLPATITTGPATVENASYDANGLRCLLQTTRGCALALKSGDFAIKPGQKLTAKIGDATTTLTADRNGEVNLKVPATANPVAISIAAQ